MNFASIFHILSYLLFGFALLLLVPLALSLYCNHISYCEIPSPTFSFFLSFVITLFLALLTYLSGKRSKELYKREAILLVLLFYLATTLLGSLPFLFSKTTSNPFQAYFESVSGITTTGFSVLDDLNLVSPTLLFWRALLSWIGGGGIIVLFIAILPTLGIGGKALFQMETTGPTKETMEPKLKETASKLWKIYVSLTLLQILLLLFTNRDLPFLEAICISFSTLSTGGFSPREGGIAAYNSLSLEMITLVFMLFGSINFSLYFYYVKGKFWKLNDPELRFYLIALLIVSLFTAYKLTGTPKTPLFETQSQNGTYTFVEALRYASFQVVSAMSTTGFTTADVNQWHASLHVLLLVLMMIGAMGGSTAGGLKIARVQIFFRIFLDKLETIFRPDSIRSYHISGRALDVQIVQTVLIFIITVVGLTILGSFLLILDGVDQETAISTIISMQSCVGFAFGQNGPTHSSAFLSNFGSAICSLWMIAGRLEYFTLLVLFVPKYWTRP